MEDCEQIVNSNIEEPTFEMKNENISLDVVSEGKATVRLSNDDKTFSAFYNPAQVNKLIFIFLI